MSTESQEPKDSGSAGTQVAAQEVSAVSVVPPATEGPLVNAVQGMGSRGFASMGAGNLMIGICLQLNQDLEASRKKEENLQCEIRALRNELSESKIKCAVLDTQLNSMRKHRKTSALLGFVGSGLIGLSVSLFQSNLFGYGLLSGGLALAALWQSWRLSTEQA